MPHADAGDEHELGNGGGEEDQVHLCLASSIEKLGGMGPFIELN